MNITSTRKVSGSSSAPHKTERYTTGSDGEPFVESIDTTNNVSVDNENHDNSDHHNQRYEQQEKKDNSNLYMPNTYIPSAIEALVASGVYDILDIPPREKSVPRKVDVYGNNQAFIKDEEEDKANQTYLKHFYEKNEVLEEVDELV